MYKLLKSCFGSCNALGSWPRRHSIIYQSIQFMNIARCVDMYTIRCTYRHKLSKSSRWRCVQMNCLTKFGLARSYQPHFVKQPCRENCTARADLSKKFLWGFWWADFLLPSQAFQYCTLADKWYYRLRDVDFVLINVKVSGLNKQKPAFQCCTRRFWCNSWCTMSGTGFAFEVSFLRNFNWKLATGDKITFDYSWIQLS